jgi:hypothetical protein
LLQLLDYLLQRRRFFALWMLTNQSIIPSVKKISLRTTEPSKYGLLHYYIASLKGAPRERKRRSEAVSHSAEKKEALTVE